MATKPGCRQPAVGTSTPRRALGRVVTGKARYVADVEEADALHVAFARSTVAHARIRAIDSGPASRLPGVVGVYTMRDLEGCGSLPPMWAVAGQRPCPELPLALDRVRHVGHAYAVVVASDKATAERAAAMIGIDLDNLPAVLTCEAALAQDAPLLYADWDDNVCARSDWLVGDPDTALAGAALVVADCFTTQRVHPLSLEGRAIMAAPDDDGGVTLHVSTQAPHQVKMAVSHAIGLPEHRIRVVVPAVGGAFGLKAYPYAEEALLARLALDLDRPVRWIEGRRESFVSSAMARDQQVSMQMGFDAEGRILALDGQILFNKGSQVGQASIGTAWVAGAFLPGGYHIPAVRIAAIGVVTNTPQTGAYRGFGQPEANFALERVLDIAAARLGMSPAEIRLRNFIQPQQMPYPIATGVVLDSGDYSGLLVKTLERFGYEQALGRCAGESSPGQRRGVGIACFIETTNSGPSAGAAYLGIRAGSFERLSLRMEASGHLRLFTGQTELGQGITTTLAQVCADELLLPIEDIAVMHGDTTQPSFTSYGTAGSAGIGVSGAATIKAARALRQKLLAWGAHLLELEIDAVELDTRPASNHNFGTETVVCDRSDPYRSVSIPDIALAANLGHSVPPGLEPGLEANVVFDPPGFAIAYGAVAVEVVVDIGTGRTKIERITFGHDCGTVINPQIVEGQIIGAVAQAIGATLYEAVSYDAEGRNHSTSMMDYLVPLAADLPRIDLVHLETQAPLYAHGAKGVGESGIIAVPAAIANAVQHAIGPEVTLNTLPLSAERIWRAVNRIDTRSIESEI